MSCRKHTFACRLGDSCGLRRRQILFVSLGLPARPVSYHILLAIPSGLPLRTHELIMQLVFERLHLSAFMLVDRTLAQMFAFGYQSALVIDVLDSSTEVSVVIDSVVEQPAKVRTQIGEHDLDVYLAYLLLQANSDLPALLSPSQALSGPALKDGLLRIIRWLKINQCIAFASESLGLHAEKPAAEVLVQPDDEEQAEEQMLSKAAAQLAQGKTAIHQTAQREAATVQVPHPFSTALPAIAIGPERHRYAEPLFDPSLLEAIPAFGDGRRKEFDALALERKSASVIDAALQSLNALDVNRRNIPVHSVVVTGRVAATPGRRDLLYSVIG